MGPFVLTIEWLEGEKLRLDGSNFSIWVASLHVLLSENDMVDYILDGMDLDPSIDLETAEERKDRYLRREMASYISVVMRFGMVDELWPFVGDVNPRSVMLQLRTHFVDQTRIWEHELMGDFLSIKMEENSSLDDHLERMHDA